jgi:hypothetical protein
LHCNGRRPCQILNIISALVNCQLAGPRLASPDVNSSIHFRMFQRHHELLCRIQPLLTADIRCFEGVASGTFLHQVFRDCRAWHRIRRCLLLVDLKNRASEEPCTRKQRCTSLIFTSDVCPQVGGADVGPYWRLLMLCLAGFWARSATLRMRSGI